MPYSVRKDLYNYEVAEDFSPNLSASKGQRTACTPSETPSVWCVCGGGGYTRLLLPFFLRLLSTAQKEGIGRIPPRLGIFMCTSLLAIFVTAFYINYLIKYQVEITYCN